MTTLSMLLVCLFDALYCAQVTTYSGIEMCLLLLLLAHIAALTSARCRLLLQQNAKCPAKRLNHLRWHWPWDLGGPNEPFIQWGPDPSQEGKILGRHASLL